ncbi:MAG: hypothetical protein NXI30_06745 [bacterium]|nr:hypothetical protein [bacterium]
MRERTASNTSNTSNASDASDPRDAAPRRPAFAERLARRERRDEIARGDAVLVGTLAGVVEWTDEAWTRLTGFPLDETVDKPITHFLDHAGLERELVEFVAHHFLEGRPCTVALPFDTFDGRRIDVTLEVERWCDEGTDSSRFIAVAREVVADVGAPTKSTAARAPVADRGVPPRPAGTSAPLGPIVARAADAGRPSRGTARAFDVHLSPARHLSVTPAEPIRPILDALLDATRHALAAGPAWVSVVAGPLEAGRSHHSLVHPIPNRRVAARAEAGAYVEVHDTGHPLDSDALERIRRGEPGDAPRERALARAALLAADAGLDLHLESTPGCGTQALLVLERG